LQREHLAIGCVVVNDQHAPACQRRLLADELTPALGRQLGQRRADGEMER
jgi:hypothetical protein